MGRSSDPESLGDGHVIRETELAILVDLEEHGETWIPKSVIHDDSSAYQAGDDGEVIVQAWWAEKEGLA